MCRVQAFALSRVPAPSSSTMLMFVWFLCLFWCFAKFDLGGDGFFGADFFFLVCVFVICGIIRYLGGFVGCAICSLCAPWVWQLFSSTCLGDVVSGDGGGSSVEFWLEFVNFLALVWACVGLMPSRFLTCWFFCTLFGPLLFSLC